jgi:hypothetical protein
MTPPSPNKLREFWIDPEINSPIDPDSPEWNNAYLIAWPNCIHVREVSPAFDDKVKMLVSVLELCQKHFQITNEVYYLNEVNKALNSLNNLAVFKDIEE